MICYRVHKTELRPGDEVRASEHFFDHLDSDRRVVEELLDECRPEGKPSRLTAIFVFENRRDAENWASERFTRRLYSVEGEFEENERLDWGEIWLALLESKGATFLP
jgi:hypothetical protein